MEHLLNREQLELCRLLSLALHNKALERLSPDVDYARVIAVAESHKVMALLHPVLEHAGLRESIWKIVDRKGEQTVRQSYRLLMLSRYVIGLLKENGIDAILLKGCGTAAWYPVPELRKSGDIDLLFKSEDETRKALQILAQQGFVTTEDQPANHHIVCESRDSVSLELHMSLAEPFDSEKTNRFLADCQKEYFAHRRVVDCMGVAFELASDGYHAFYLLLHMLQHYVRAGFGVKLLCDWVVFWESPLSEEEKKIFLRLTQESGTFGFAVMMTRVCVKYLGLREKQVEFLMQAEPKDVCDLTEELMAEIFEAEEFGHSSKDRMVVLRGTGLMDYAREFHHQMKLNYPKAGKIMVLYPVLWIMTLCGFLYRNRTLRKVSGRQILKKAKKRSQLTEQMRLFQ
ncbi:MAG: nucleotidyltransferase family protein [Lachnobacterium sp.]|nr:nucleotidyltransferase family protein [Lachnobacterium sp.]